MWSIIPTFAMLIAQAQPSSPPKWCFERTQGALLCEETEDACTQLRSINTEIATSPCKRVEPPPPPSPEKQTPTEPKV
jgi:hypothetical protein